MNIDFQLFPEPRLQFGQFFEHEDSKTGLAEYGPFGKNVQGLHPSEVKIGFIGTRETIAGAHEWVEECAGKIESRTMKRTSLRHPEAKMLFNEQDIGESQIPRLEKIINRDFIGFNLDSEFKCCFQLNDRWIRYLLPKDINHTLRTKDKTDRIRKLVTLIGSQVESLATTPPAPDVIIIALTSEMFTKAHSARVTGNFHLNLRRALKACAMKWGVPIQLIRSATIKGTDIALQEKATRAWNFCAAQYYKADGVLWRPITVEPDVCFVGISFFVATDEKDKLTMRSSVAQAFDFLGQGIVLRGDPFEWDIGKHGRTPHLSKSSAAKLIARTLREYEKVRGLPPKRVVIQKSSGFWGADHPQFNEREGFEEGICEVFPRCETDFLTLQQTGLRLFREGKYPPLRGMYFCLEKVHHFLYTMGYIPYLQTYPGSYVPEPWELTEHHGESDPKQLLKEVLMLTKMNVNNCSYADGVPITLQFSRNIGEIMKHIPQGEDAKAQYKFYM